MDFSKNEDLAPMAIEKSKSWGPFWSYQLNSTANSAHLARILILSIAIDADYSYVMKNSKHNNSFIATVIKVS